MWSCQHLDFGLLASRAVREYISVVLSHPVCGNLLWQSWETKAAGYIDSNWFSKNTGESIFFCLVCCIWFWQDAADNAGALPRGPQRTPIYIFCPLSPFQCAFKYTYLFLVLAVLGLHCCTRAFSSCHEWGLLSSCGVQASRAWASVVAVCGLSCSMTCGSSLTRDHTCVLCFGRQILNQWTTREVAISVLLLPNTQLFFGRWPSDSPVALPAKVGSCYIGHRELILLLCDNLEGWDGVGGEVQEGGEHMCTCG